MTCRAIISGFFFAVAVAIACASSAIGAENLNITQAQLDNLGIVLGQPKALQLADDLSVPGRVKVPPKNDFAVVPIFAGTIKRLAVASGQDITAGEPIAWMASSEFLSAQREYNDAMHGLSLANKQLERDQTLHDEGIVSDRRFDEAQHSVHELQMSAKTLEQSLMLAGMTRTDIRNLSDSLDLHLEMIIRAPVTGVVLEQFAVAGQRLDGSEPICRIADLNRLWLEIDVPVRRSAEIVSGAVVLIDPQGARIQSTVLHVGRNVNVENQTVVVRAIIEDGAALMPGQFVSAALTSSAENGFLELPSKSVIRRDGKSYVFIQSASGITVREVQVVRQSQGRTIIGAGLGGDESVVIEGSIALKATWLGMGGGD